jgi:glycosyltransferase involved in cell wall biosynthesis
VRFALITTNLRGGGAEKAMLNMADLLRRRGHGVELILLEATAEHALPADIVPRVVTQTGHRLGKGWFGKRVAAWRLRRLWRRLEREGAFDLVVSTLPFCDEVVRLARLPRARYRIANTLTVEIALLARRDTGKAERRLRRYRAMYEGQGLIAVSAGVAADLREGLGLRKADIETIRNPFDIGAIRAHAAQPEPELPPEPYIVHVGRCMPQKRHDLLLDAFRESHLPQRLVLLAEPSAKLTQLIEVRGLGGRVTVTGFRRNPYPWIARAELLVLCSDHEGMPNVLVEALICGTRVVSTDCPSGPAEVLQGELARWLVPCGDVAALAQAMRDALAAAPPETGDRLRDFAADRVAARYEMLAARMAGVA